MRTAYGPHRLADWLQRSDDEEFYKPLLLQLKSTSEYLDAAFRWQAFYNLYRPHYAAGMDGMSPIEELRSKGLELKDSFALMSPIVLGSVASQIAARGGYHVQGHYTGAAAFSAPQAAAGPQIVPGSCHFGSESGRLRPLRATTEKQAAGLRT